MNRSTLPAGSFVDPSGHNRARVEQLARTALGVALEHLFEAASRSPLPEDSSIGIERVIPEEVIPEKSVAPPELMDELDNLLAGSMNPAHPGFMGHMDPMPTTISVLGDLLAAAANNNMLSHEMSPAFSQLEDALCREFARLFGLGDGSGGVMTSGGSLANLHALAVARNAAFEGCAEEGVAGRRPAVFASEAAHTSIRKAAMLLGLGTEAVQSVDTDADVRMNPEALACRIESAEARGQAPFAVVATAGTTTTGNIDPLPAIAEVAKAHGLWLHVDAAYGGALVFSGEHRSRLDGIERADSVTFNPQKWCYVAKTAAMALFNDFGRAQDVFRIRAPYMASAQEAVNLGEISVQGTRHADALKLWLTLAHLGRSGLEQLIDESYRLTRRFVEKVDERSFLERASRPETNLVCFRFASAGATPQDNDQRTTALGHELLREWDTFLSLPHYRGRRWLRAVLLNPFTEEEHLERVLDGVDAFASRTANASS